jgi:hypothetical protein
MALIRWSTELELKALAEGRTAFEAGYDMDDNPWLETTREFVAWCDGWNEGQLAAEDERVERLIDSDDGFELDEDEIDEEDEDDE